jgi:hypothetical protein
MSDDRLLSALRSLGNEELSVGADRAIRDRLEVAWKPRARQAFAFPSIRRFVPVLAALVLVAGSAGAVLGAGADSPLWDTRVALEDAAASLRLSADDRVAYLFELVQSRTEEAARQEAAGHAGAAAKARAAASSAIVTLDGNIPQIDAPVPQESPRPTPPPANSPSPSPSPSASGSPAAQLPASGSPSATPPPAPRTSPPVPTRTATPTVRPTVTPTKPTITFTGTVRDASGANVSEACITTSQTIPTSTTSCITKTKNGSYGFSVPAEPGQAITLYAYWKDAAGQTFAGSSSTNATKPTTLMPAITLTLRR